MKKKLTVLVWILVILVVTLIIDSMYLDRSTPVEDADVIVMLGGGDEGRMKRAGELYEQGYADYVFITPVVESDNSKQSTEIANKYGIATEAIIYDYDADSTYENVLVTFEMMDEYEFDSAIIVTSDYHVKRSRMIFERLNDGFDLYYSGAPHISGSSWYELDYSRHLWRSEFVKYWGYVVGRW